MNDIEQLKADLEAWTDDDLWELEDNALVYQGEEADGDPSWHVVENFGFRVRFERGWYVQEGDADRHDDVIPLMEAMVAAFHALDESLRAREQAAQRAEPRETQTEPEKQPLFSSTVVPPSLLRLDQEGRVLCHCPECDKEHKSLATAMADMARSLLRAYGGDVVREYLGRPQPPAGGKIDPSPSPSDFSTTGECLACGKIALVERGLCGPCQSKAEPCPCDDCAYDTSDPHSCLSEWRGKPEAPADCANWTAKKAPDE